jgi:hypothetical protein
MPHSETEPGRVDIRLAVAAELLYLINLLLLPGIAFAVLIVLYLSQRKTAGFLAINHLRQTLAASVWAGVLLIIVSVIALLAGGWDEPGTWVFLILYFTTCHASLVLLGVIGLVKAMTAQRYRYPVIGID